MYRITIKIILRKQEADMVSPQKYQLFQEVSAGGVVFRKQGNSIEYAIIERAAMGDRTLPKGHQDPNVSLQDTAKREVLEETGFRTNPIAYIGKFAYSVKNEEKKKFVIRLVHWFLMEYEGGETIKANEEVKKAIWVPLSYDISQMSHENDRGIVRRAVARLRKMFK